MTYNQKIVSVMTVFLLGITAAITFTFFEPPFTTNFKISLGFIFFAEFMFGAFWVQQIGKSNAMLPISIGVWGINLIYLLVVFALAFFTNCETRYFSLWEVIGLAVYVVAHLFFRLAEHRVEEMSKEDVPEQKIERAKVTWR